MARMAVTLNVLPRIASIFETDLFVYNIAMATIT